MKKFWRKTRRYCAEWLERLSLPGGRRAAKAAAVRQTACDHCAQGRPYEAALLLQTLIENLEAGSQSQERRREIAASRHALGDIWLSAGQPETALEPLNKAIGHFEALGASNNAALAAALNSLADCQSRLGHTDTALSVAERALTIYRNLDDMRAAAALLRFSADIYAQQRRFAEAESHYIEASNAAMLAGDPVLEGAILQRQGVLMRRQKQHAQAAELFDYAIRLFQKAGAVKDEMQTCDMLATVQVILDDLDAAEIWYMRSRDLAKQEGDRHQTAVVAQNMGILLQKRAEQAASPETRQALLNKAVSSIEHSLAIKLELANQEGLEASYFQLGVLHWKAGDSTLAREYLLQATAISESLHLGKVYKNYSVLAQLARAGGDEEEAARWQLKCDAKVAELMWRLREHPETQ